MRRFGIAAISGAASLTPPRNRRGSKGKFGQSMPPNGGCGSYSRASHFTGSRLLGQLRHEVERHVDASRYARRHDVLAIFDPALLHVLRAELAEDSVPEP